MVIRNALFSLIIALLSSASVLAQAENAPEFKFDETKHDFGDIILGDVVEFNWQDRTTE